MKKKFIISIICLSITILIITLLSLNNSKNDNGIQKIKMAEVTHSVFYAPLYVSIENGYFKNNGIDLDVILTPGADKVAAAVLSNDCQIGFAGPESAIYVYNGGEKDYIQAFAGLTKRDGQFIISKNKDFKLTDLYNKEILVGRYAGMPSLNFINALKNNNIDINKIKLNYSVEFAALSGSFISGIGDYVNLFEPNATALEKEGYGYVVESIGALSGEVPYTTFYSKKSYINNNNELLINFTKAINEGLAYVNTHSANEIADIILPQFPDLSKNSLVNIIERYKKYDTWLTNPYISEESYNNLQDIMNSANILDKYVPYEDLIINLYEK